MTRSVLILAAVAFVGLLGTNSAANEQVRLRAHFDSVLHELRIRDVSAFSAQQRANREQLVSWLADYRDAGRFPLNDRYPDHRTPIFRDTRGVTCAMAYLIDRSGRRDIVDRISATRNLGYIRELADDTSLTSWLDHAGLSVDEAARIQPTYGGDEADRKALASITAVFSGASLAMAVSNVMKPKELKGFLGMAVGGVTLLAAAAMSHEHSALTAVNVGAGSAAVVAGFYAAFRPRPVARRSTDRIGARRKHEFVPIVGLAPKRNGAVLGLVARF